MRVLFRLGAFFVVVFLLIPKAWGQAQVFPQWTARFHRLNSDLSAAGEVTSGSTLNAIAVDAQGNSYIGLTVCLDVTLGCPDRESLTFKYDADGHLQWKAWLSSPVHLGVGALEKLDGKGLPLWSAPVTDSPVNLAVNAFGDVYVAGLHSVTKYSVNGAKLWSQPFTGSAAAMTIGGDGALVVTGSATGSGNDWITTNYIQDAAKLTPATLSFGNQLLGKQCASQTVTLTNTAETDLAIRSITVTGDFHLANNCPTALAAGASCKLGVTFTPTELGARTGTLSVLDDWEGSEHNPQTVKLSGTGVAP
jgi:hypothetical protein